MHLQKKKSQAKIITVVHGKILDVVVDLRKNSKTYGKYFAIEIEDKSDFSLFIPKTLHMDFYAYLSFVLCTINVQIIEMLKSETTIKWDDKKLNIKWPIKRPILSKRLKGILFEDFK